MAALAVHGRTRAQGYSGAADWDVIAEAKRKVSVPLIGNGDVTSASEARRMLLETGCDAVMIGRGSFGNPWIFRETRALLGREVGIEQESGHADDAVHRRAYLMAHVGEEF